MRVWTCSYSRSRCGWHQAQLTRPGALRGSKYHQKLSKLAPAVRGRLRRLPLLQRCKRASRGLEMIERVAGIRRAHAGQELHNPERGDGIARIVRPAQHREEILDMRRLEKFEAAVFHVRNAAPRKFHLQDVAVA